MYQGKSYEYGHFSKIAGISVVIVVFQSEIDPLHLCEPVSNDRDEGSSSRRFPRRAKYERSRQSREARLY